jgi:hypothetical protein
LETPLTPQELVAALVEERILRFKTDIERQRTSGGNLYQPKGLFNIHQHIIFPAVTWRSGEIIDIREGHNPDLGEFKVIQVAFEDGSHRDFASGLREHKLNAPPKFEDHFTVYDIQTVLRLYQEDLIETLEEELKNNPDFVRIAGRWFPRALLVDINAGHLNLAEAVLDMMGGGPLPTSSLLEQVELSSSANSKLVEFSIDLALQNDSRFDEVGPAGEVQWFLRRLEPPEVLDPPPFLRYQGIDYDRTMLTKEMQILEQDIDDELSPLEGKSLTSNEGEVRLIFPHWRSGTLPLATSIRHLFPTAFEAPHIRFTFVDKDTGKSFPGWVVREKRYVHGLKDWYETKGAIPGTVVRVHIDDNPGVVHIQIESRRQTRDWIRTVLVGSDGGVVFAMLKQPTQTRYDERMTIAIPDKEALDEVWNRSQKENIPFERIVVNHVKELSKLNPQGHIHASELYAAINIIRRCPPGPILALLASRPWFIHVGDLHFRLSDSAYE